MNGFERVSGGWVVPQVVQIADLLHAEPAELGAAEGARHVVARAVVHLGDEHLAARARLDVVACSSTTKSETEKFKKTKKPKEVAARVRFMSLTGFHLVLPSFPRSVHLWCQSL